MKRIPITLPAVALATALAGCGTDVAGPGGSLLSCVFSEPVATAPGDVLQVRGAGNQALCLAGADASAFVYIPFFATRPPDDDEEEPVRLAVEIDGGGFETVATTGLAPGRADLPPAAWIGRAPARRPAQDAGFHRLLRELERRELGPKIRGGSGAESAFEPVTARALDVPEVGDLLPFNVRISCSQEDVRVGRVEYVSEHAVVVADTQNPAGLGAADYQHFAVTFDTLVYPVDTEHFGTPTDIDANGRSIIFFTRAVNERSQPGAETFTGGFFWSGDLFPETGTSRLEGCPAANQAEMFYMLTADPDGEVGIVVEVDFLREIAVGIIGHEYQHLINASRRLHVNDANTFEDAWLNEGLSHVAEELLFYAAAGLAPGANLGIQDVRGAPNGVAAFNAYAAGNFGNYGRYLERPDTASLMGEADILPTRGATWAFLRYAADRTGRDDAEFFVDVVNSREAGLTNLDAVLGESALAWMQDWTVAVYTDDHVPVDARFRSPSWNFRSIYPETSLERFPLALITLTAGEPRAVTLRPGGAAFPVFGIAGGERAVLHVEADGRVPPAALRGSVVRIR